MQTEGLEAEKHLNDPSYQENAVQKAMTGMLELTMATMYTNAMNRAVEADFEKAVRDYYAKSINMVKECQEAFANRDRFRAEGLRQNGLVKQLLAEQEPLKETIQELQKEISECQ